MEKRKLFILSCVLVGCVLGLFFGKSAMAATYEIEVDNASPLEAQKVLDNFKNETEQSTTVTEGNRLARAVTYSYSAWFKRGSALMWSKDHFNWKVSNSKIISSSGWQEAGWIFPNIVKKKGVTRYSTESSLHKWRATKNIGAGVVTPWGDVKVYGTDYTDYYGLKNNGGAVWY